MIIINVYVTIFINGVITFITMKQAELSNFIKSVHKKLREESEKLGAEQAWQNHCRDAETLEKYAFTMQQLAVEYWDKNSELDPKVKSRVIWVYTSCKEYFASIDKFRDKEISIKKSVDGFNEVTAMNVRQIGEVTKYKLLDVGSCYNPFKEFEEFEVVPVDIAPANKEVLKCDFLNVKVKDSSILENQQVKQLEENSFHIIVFSLLLEYFPEPEQRLKCCLKAYELLKPEGILAIITPDSNHVGSNAKIYKSWRYILAKHGFMRVKYEKLPYIHGMIFRKALYKLVPQRWSEMAQSDNIFQEMFIPQDFREKEMEKMEDSQDMKIRDHWCSDSFLQNLGDNLNS